MKKLLLLTFLIITTLAYSKTTYKWDLNEVFKNEKALEIEKNSIYKASLSFRNYYENSLNKLNEKEFIFAFYIYESLLERVAKILTYTHLKYSKDLKNAPLFFKYQKITMDIQENLLFFEIEFNELNPEKQEAFIMALKDKGEYLKYIKSFKQHQLNFNQEKILLKKNLTSFNAFVRLFDKEVIELEFDILNHKVNLGAILAGNFAKDRDLRIKANESLLKGLESSLELFTYIFNMIKSDLKINCELKNYSIAEEPRNKDNKITKEVVDNLLLVIKDNFSILQEYYKFKAKYLKIENFYDYDRFTPIGESKSKYEFEKSKEIILNAYRNFSNEFYELALRAFDESWIDVYPSQNKQIGAFSNGSIISLHPFILLNYTDTRRDLFTLAHELGHSIHQYLVAQSGYLSASVPIILSESVSLFSEMLVFDYLVKELNHEEKLSLYSERVEEIFLNLFEKAVFTNFERRVHSNEEELTKKEFNKIWQEENFKMFGDSVAMSEAYKLSWSYFPHFIKTPFYSYSYSFGQLLVLAFYDLYKSDTTFKDRYVDFLKKSGVKSPIELIKEFGYDINSKEFWEVGIEKLREITRKFEKLLK